MSQTSRVDITDETSSTGHTTSENGNRQETAAGSGQLYAGGVGLQPPTLSHQHTALLHLSMLEENCKLKALQRLNEDRLPADKLGEDDPEVISLRNTLFQDLVQNLDKQGVLPTPEYAGPAGIHLRKAYMKGLDAILDNAARKEIRKLDSREFSGALENSAQLVNGGEAAIHSFPMGPLNLGPVTSNHPPQGSSANDLITGGAYNSFASRSDFITDYAEQGVIGKGGYGTVYKVHNHLDNCQYAIKKILISSQKLQKFRETAQVDALLAELRTLARLNHKNIVRYYHGWIETPDSQLGGAAQVPQRLLLTAGNQSSSRFGRLGNCKRDILTCRSDIAIRMLTICGLAILTSTWTRAGTLICNTCMKVYKTERIMMTTSFLGTLLCHEIRRAVSSKHSQ
jgi:hypothetical protein